MQHNYNFDPTNGLKEEELLKLTAPEEPADFVNFWKDIHSRVMSQKLDYIVERKIWSEYPNTIVYLVRAKTFDNREIGIWISRPENSKGGILSGQGYGNPSQPSSDGEFTICFPCVRGLGISQCEDIPWLPKQHVIFGIENKETYVVGGMIGDLYLATNIMIDMFPDTAKNLNYTGGSLGGGMGALLLPWDLRFKAAYLNVPTFGNNPERIKYQSAGSGEAIRLYVNEHPEAMDVLVYFDAAISAKYINIPTIVAPALFDPVVAPVGQFSIANSIPQKNKHLFIAQTGHFTQGSEDIKMYEELMILRNKLFDN